MSAKAVVVFDNKGVPVPNAETSLGGMYLFPLTNTDGYSLYPSSLTSMGTYLKVIANGALSYLQRVSLDGADQEIHVGGDPNAGPPNTIHLPPLSFKHALQPPTREEVCSGQTTQQGFTVTTTEFGQMPWWGGCWAWLSPLSRQEAAQQLLHHGDTVCLIGVPSEGALYPEPNQFYSEDKFPALSMTDVQVVAMVQEAIDLGFRSVWLFLGGDDGGTNGYPIAIAQTQVLGPALGALNASVCQFPGWDGVWYGYTPEQIGAFAAAARAAGAVYVGVEHSTGHLLAGEGGGDYLPGGVMTGYDVILGEFNSGQFDGTVWQVLGRMIDPYVWPTDQPAGSDQNPAPKYLAPGSPRGPYVYRVFEYGIYEWVRGTPPETIARWKAYFEACGATNVC